MKSDTVNLDHFVIKDIPGSSGRLDVIARCILAALLNGDKFQENHRIIIFLKKYGTLIFNPQELQYAIFPKDEILLCDYIYKLLKSKNNNIKLGENPLAFVKRSTISMNTYLHKLLDQKKPVYLLKESGVPFSKVLWKDKQPQELYLIVGNQSEDFINSFEFLDLNIPKIRLGTRSLLASTSIRLIGLKLKLLF
jgi:tRNA (pseudouridine54-N1)-methyltransferase